MDNNKLTEVLNIEISQGVIVSAEEAVDWVKGTFLYRRILSNPLLYGFNGKGNDALHSFIHEMCKTCIDNLQKIRAISVYENGTFFPEAGCHVMSRNYIDFEAMKAIVKLPHDSGPVQLLRMMSNCAKIQIPIRRNEKKALNEAYKTIKYKLEGPQSKVRIQTDAEKCFVMLQAAIGQYFFGEFSLRQQMSYMIDGASQVLSAIEQYAKEGSRNGQVAIQAMLFRRSLYSSLWGEHDGVLNQIGGVTQDMAAKLKASGISSFADAMSRSNEDIVKAINVTDAFANSLRVAASTILHRTLNLSAGFNENDDDGGCELNVKLNRRVAGSIEEIHKKVVSYSLVIFTDRAGGLLHFSDDVSNPATLSLRLPEKETFGRV
jgi:ATP-dependent DNA helicase HFM1/MER3